MKPEELLAHRDFVRTRLKRGLEQMCLRLDAMYGGERHHWLSLLVALAGLQVAAASAKAPPPPPPRVWPAPFLLLFTER
jgi:hypothetical protein